jgi:hypothetical protein
LSTGAFKTAGGLLSAGETTWVNVDEDFSGASGTGGGLFFDVASGPTSWMPGWDEGLEGEAAFAGYWEAAPDNVTVSGGTTAQANLTAGVDDGPAAELTVADIDVDPVDGGGWWSGLMWQDQTFPNRPLSEVILRADVKGVLGTGGRLGLVHVRIEDADGDHLAFTARATEDFQRIGGPLNSPEVIEGTFPGLGDGDFREDRGPHTVVVSFYDEWNTWGSGGTLVVDNVFLTAPEFGDGAEGFTAAVAFAGETTTWPFGGSLSVDNLGVAVVSPDTNGDGFTDLADFGHFRSCLSGQAGGLNVLSCLPFDADGDNDVDLVDFTRFLQEYDGP